MTIDHHLKHLSTLYPTFEEGTVVSMRTEPLTLATVRDSYRHLNIKSGYVGETILVDYHRKPGEYYWNSATHFKFERHP